MHMNTETELATSPELKPKTISLEESERRYRRLFETAQDGILILDAESGQIDDVNPFLTNLLGYSREHLLGCKLWEIGTFSDIAASKADFRELQQRAYVRYEDLPLQTSDGRRINVEFVSNVYLEDGRRVVQCNVRDITVRRGLEDQLRQSQRMETFGQLAGGVAHDYNNILTSTLLHLSLLLDNPNLKEPMRRSLLQLKADADRSASLTRQLLMFSRRQPVMLKPTDLNEALANLYSLLRRLIGEDVKMDFRSSSSVILVNADIGMLEQVVMNLCVNARDAMAPKGGQLTIESDVVALDTEAQRENPEARAGSFARISVTDTGCGMDEATSSRSFEPFFTTKALGKGTGLGLATVYAIAKQHSGWVEVSSAVGRGSTFKFYLPVLAEGSAGTAEAAGADPRKGSETVLLVEDEDEVRHLVQAGLERFGYYVLVAVDGVEAIAIWEHRSTEIDLLFADMRMPKGVSGLDLCRLFKAKKPELKVIISSGYSDEIAAGIPFDEKITYLHKPYDARRLGTVVRNCLDETG
jgi:two-component system cell cycle sensor histidine kinase/response regulator CckA